MASSGMSIRTLSSREVYRNKWLAVREDRIERFHGDEKGVEGIYSVVDKDDCAAIIAIDHDENGDFIYLVEQYRYTIQQRCLELPQGGWEEPVDDPEELARGELREETGLSAKKMTCLGMLHIAYGFANQKQFIYLAEGLTKGEVDRDAEEHDLIIHRVPVVDFESMMREGKIQDASTLGAWALYRLSPHA
jgi:8-oxo-dGTP pyrophosphatase MutT (NUDIX family)